MWHPDIDPEFYDYACDVLARHGESLPVLVNYDLMHEAELRSGIPARGRLEGGLQRMPVVLHPGQRVLRPGLSTRST